MTSSSRRSDLKAAGGGDASTMTSIASHAHMERSLSVTSSTSKRSSKADVKSTGSSDVSDGGAGASVDDFGMSRLEADDIGKMKERASKNQMFLFVKVPEVHLTVSYKVKECFSH